MAHGAPGTTDVVRTLPALHVHLAEKAIHAHVDIAREHGLDPAQMALAYVNSRSFLTSNIGATTLDQLESNLASETLTLDDSAGSHRKRAPSAPQPCPDACRACLSKR